MMSTTICSRKCSKCIISKLFRIIINLSIILILVLLINLELNALDKDLMDNFLVKLKNETDDEKLKEIILDILDNVADIKFTINLIKIVDESLHLRLVELLRQIKIDNMNMLRHEFWKLAKVRLLS